MGKFAKIKTGFKVLNKASLVTGVAIGALDGEDPCDVDNAIGHTECAAEQIERAQLGFTAIRIGLQASLKSYAKTLDKIEDAAPSISRTIKILEKVPTVGSALKTIRLDTVADQVGDKAGQVKDLAESIDSTLGKIDTLMSAMKITLRGTSVHLQNEKDKIEGAAADVLDSIEARTETIDKELESETGDEMEARIEQASDDLESKISGLTSAQQDNVVKIQALGDLLEDVEQFIVNFESVSANLADFVVRLNSLVSPLNPIANALENITSPLEPVFDAIDPFLDVLDKAQEVIDAVLGPIIKELLDGFGLNGVLNDIRNSILSKILPINAFDTELTGFSNSVITIDDLTTVIADAISSASADIVAGLSNADILEYTDIGYSGDDDLSGKSIIYGGGGDDTITGDAGGYDNTHLFGEAGNDKITGTSVRDFIVGGEGDDSLSGDGGDDAIIGGEGDDSIDGGAGDDALSGGEGYDTLDGGADDDDIQGGNGDDLLKGSSGNDTIEGGFGNDTIDGGSGGDMINLGSGNDVIETSLSNLNGDKIINFFSNDTIRILDQKLEDGSLSISKNEDLGGLDVTIKRAGVDLAEFTLIRDYASPSQFFISNEEGTNHSIIKYIPSAPEPDPIDKTPRDVTEPEDDATYIAGGAGDDYLDGGNSNAYIDGGAGDDTITAGSGNSPVYGGAGDDSVSAGGGNDAAFGGTGKDSMDGGDGNDMLQGNQGNDLLQGGTGNDTLDGGVGNDDLLGGSGNDNIDGGAGNDALSGGIGNDGLRGGSGVDTFIFTQEELANGDIDTIVDFSGDELVFEGVDYHYLGNAEFSNVAGQLRATTDGSHSKFEYDADGDGVADWTLIMLGVSDPPDESL